MIVSQRPVGPWYLITPWNFPLAMATRKIGRALAAGCTVVIKPAQLTPLTTLYVVKLMEEAGLPKGVVNVLTSRSSSAVSEPILRDERLRKLSFAGSTPVGISLMKQAADKVLCTSMELGGNAPFIVFDDADLDNAVDEAMRAKFRNIGQACTAGNRFIVHASIVEEFTLRVTEKVRPMRIGRGTDEGVTIGPLIDEKAVATASVLVADALKRGATLRTGGKAIEGEGTFFERTVISGVTPGTDILREEIFGPVLSITTFADEDEAVRVANDTEYGLVGYVFTQDLASGQRLIGFTRHRHDGTERRSALERCSTLRWRQTVGTRPRGRTRRHSRVPRAEIHDDTRPLRLIPCLAARSSEQSKADADVY